MLDCLIIGGGPAGLTAAIYLARFRRDIELINGGESRAALIQLPRLSRRRVGGRAARAAACTGGTLREPLGARSQLAVKVGAAVDASNAILVDNHQQTTVPDLYAVGDVVAALNQISVAMGQAAIAATAIHNRF